MAVNLDFISSQLARLTQLIDEVRQLRAVSDVDRANARSLSANVVAAIARHISALDTKLEIGIADLDGRLAEIDAKLDYIVVRLNKGTR
jgi:hypothetical protein